MADIAPLISSIPDSGGRIFPGVLTNSSKLIDGPMVEASLGADATLFLVFQVPQTLPSGTAKLRLLSLANATSGVAKVNPTWLSVAAEEDFAGTRTAEGTSTVTWASGDAYVFKETKITLDADTVVAAELIVLDLVFETASWTLAANSLWLPSVIWE